MRQSKKYILVLTFVLMMSFIIKATIIEEYKLEPALVYVKYKRLVVTDTLNPQERYREDLLTLTTGMSQSAFYSSELKTQDSISNRNFDFIITMLSNNEMFRQYANLEDEAIFKNYPKSKVTVHQRFNSENWIYEEDYETPTWIITDSISTLMQYQCILAIGKFRGRTWNVLFTPDIPISNGPWKLGGLPGLILKAYDSKRHYTYDAIEISFPKDKYVEYFNYDDRIKTERKKALCRKRKHLNDNLIRSSTNCGIKNYKDIKYQKDNYDFEEIDYQHE